MINGLRTSLQVLRAQDVRAVGDWPKLPSLYPEFSAEICNGAQSHSRVIHTSELLDQNGLVALPSLGAFRAGYLLLAPKLRCSSFAMLTSEALGLAENQVEIWRSIAHRLFGESIIAEHGSSSSCDRSAACISHAHLHLIPMPGLRSAVFERYVGAGGNPDESFTSLTDLPVIAEGEPYILLSIAPGQYHVWFEVERFPRQFVRRICAELLDLGQLYNWRSNPFSEMMEATGAVYSQLELDKILSSQKLQDPAILTEVIRWNTPWELPDLPDLVSNPFWELLDERDSERLLVLSQLKAEQIAEEAFDQLRYQHKQGILSPTQRSRAISSACEALRVGYSRAVTEAARDLLKEIQSQREV